jgi:hypothetical protein
MNMYVFHESSLKNRKVRTSGMARGGGPRFHSYWFSKPLTPAVRASLTEPSAHGAGSRMHSPTDERSRFQPVQPLSGIV